MTAWVLGNCRFAQQAIPAPLTVDTHDHSDHYWKPEFKVKGRTPESAPEAKAPIEWGQKSYLDVGHVDRHVTLWAMEPSGNIVTHEEESGMYVTHGDVFMDEYIWQGRFDHATGELSVAPAPGHWNEQLSSSLVDRLRKMFKPKSISRFAVRNR